MSGRHVRLTNPEPVTWACGCGQINLLGDRRCRACDGERDESWEESDLDTVEFEARLRKLRRDLHLR